MLKSKLPRGQRILNCVKNKQCGGRCLGVKEVCRQDSKQVSQVVRQLVGGRKIVRLKRSAKKIQYITNREALLMRAVVSSKDSLKDMNTGRAPHPLIKVLKVTPEQVDRVLKTLKETGQKGLLERMSNAGIRAQGKEKSLSADTQRRLFVEAYLRQGGLDFYTGKRLNLSLSSLDHLVPLSKGGTNTSDNLALTARNINFWKKDSTQNELQALLRLKTNSIDGNIGNRMREALASGDQKKVLALRKEATEEIRQKAIRAAREQAYQLKLGTGKKLERYAKYDQMKWVAFDTAAKIDALSTADIKELLRAQKNETVGSNKPLVYVWRSSPTQNGSQQSLPTKNAAKAQAMIQAGVPRADIPAKYLDELRTAIATNVSREGRSNLRTGLGPDYDDLFNN